MRRKSSVCTLYNIRAYATPASNAFHVRPSLSRAAPELFLKISSAEGGLNSTAGEASMLTRESGRERRDVYGCDLAVHRFKYARKLGDGERQQWKVKREGARRAHQAAPSKIFAGFLTMWYTYKAHLPMTLRLVLRFSRHKNPSSHIPSKALAAVLLTFLCQHQ